MDDIIDLLVQKISSVEMDFIVVFIAGLFCGLILGYFFFRKKDKKDKFKKEFIKGYELKLTDKDKDFDSLLAEIDKIVAQSNAQIQELAEREGAVFKSYTTKNKKV